MTENYEINLNKKLSERTTDYRVNEYVHQELYNGVWYDTVYACDSTSSCDQPWLGD